MFASILAIITSIPEILKGLNALLGFMQKNFGPDWAKRMQGLRDANALLDQAKTKEETDEALIAVSRAFYNK